MVEFILGFLSSSILILGSAMLLDFLATRLDEDHNPPTGI